MSAKAGVEIYHTKELAAFFQVAEKTIWEWCRDGKLPAFKIGKEWRVRAEDLRRLIDTKVRVSQQGGAKGRALF